MNYSTQKKNKQLGMPVGTASGRLKKNILFSLLLRLNENICFQCKEPIVLAEDLSVEHKIPWLDNDVKLFWDLDNIAFSHLSCNSGASRPAYATRKNGPQGTSWCTDCRDFHPHKNKRTGLQNYCKVHKKNHRY